MDRSERRILDAAAVVFSRYGFRQTSVGQVAEEAGLTRQSLYRYFENKEALFLAALRDLHEGALEQASAAGDAAGPLDLADRLAGQVSAWLNFYADKLDASPHADELVEEGARQYGAVTVSYGQRLTELLAQTVMSHAGAKAERAKTLANLLAASARGLKSARPRLSREDLTAQVAGAARLLVTGAEALGYFK